VPNDEPAQLAIEEQVRALMWRHVGVVRSASGLENALARLGELGHRARSRSARNLVSVAKLVATAALERRESRGAHHRSDSPEADGKSRVRMAMTAPFSSDYRPAGSKETILQ
jgi:L-aspartate oxidase